MRLVAVHAGRPQRRPRPDAPDRRWLSAIHKQPVTGPVLLRRDNLDGDRQADPRVHGGPERAVMVYGAERYPLWAAELGRELEFGAFGENLTVEGFAEDTACLGDVYRVGEATIQLSEVRGPCYKVQYRTGVPDMIERINASGRSGVYARVLREGRLGAGDSIELLERPNPGWTAVRARRAYDSMKRDPEAARPLLALTGLSANWRATLERHLPAAGLVEHRP